MTTDELNIMADVSMTTEEVNQTTSTGSSLEMASVFTSSLTLPTSDTGNRSQIIPKDKPKIRARVLKHIHKRPCKFYQVGKCRYGDRCWLSHDTCGVSDLVAQQLPGADLVAQQLPGADLVGQQLPGADLVAQQLPGADLVAQQLPGADLVAQQLPGADLVAQQLPGDRDHEQDSNVEMTLQSESSTVAIAVNAGNGHVITSQNGHNIVGNGRSIARNRHTTAGDKSDTGLSCTTEGQNEVTGAVAACKFYARTGRCRFGKQCRYTHCSVSSKVADSPARDSAGVTNEAVRSHPPQSGRKTNTPTTTHIGPKRTSVQERKICRYFKVGTCKMGDLCKFRHPQSGVCSVVNDQHPEVLSSHQGSSCEPIKQEASRKPNMRAFIGGFKKLSLDKLSADDLKKMRQTEIEQLKKRYPKASETTNDPGCYKFIFVPSDPDWVS